MFERSVGDLVSAGDAANRERRWVDAERAYAAALNLNPEQKLIWIQYGHSLKELGISADPTGKVQLFAQAETAYRRALALDDAAADAYLQLGHILKLQNRVDEAILAYEACGRLDPRSKAAARELRALKGASTRTLGRLAAVPFAQLLLKRHRGKPALSKVPSADGTDADIGTGRSGAARYEARSQGRDGRLSDIDTSDIKALYLLLLGRFPEPDAFSENRGRAVIDLTRDLVRSGEFRRLVLVPLLSGRATRHEQLDQADFEFVRSWVDALYGETRDAARSWADLLTRFFGVEPLGNVFSTAVVGMLRAGSEPVSGKELIGDLFGHEGITVEMLVGDTVSTELTMTAPERLDKDVRDSISRFNLAIPVDSVQAASGHRFVVRDTRTRLAVPSGRFAARLVPRFEGGLAGSCTRLSGWVRRADLPEHRVMIELRDGEQVLCSAVADRPTGNPLAGDSGFELPLPPTVPGTAGILLDGIPIALLTENITVPARVLRGNWQVEFGRSDVVVTAENVPGCSPLPIGFTLDNIVDGVSRYGPDHILDGIDELFARGDDPEPAIGEVLRYIAISRDHRLLRSLSGRWTSFIVGRPRVFEQLLMLYLGFGDLNAARQLMDMAQTSGSEAQLSLGMASAMLAFCAIDTQRHHKHSRLDPFSYHRDALNSVYNSLVVAVTRQRIWLEQLLQKIEKQ